jgi:hypothetical protein
VGSEYYHTVVGTSGIFELEWGWGNSSKAAPVFRLAIVMDELMEVVVKRGFEGG